MSSQYSFRTEALQTAHAKVFSLLMLCLVVHEFVEVLNENIMLIFVFWKALSLTIDDELLRSIPYRIAYLR